MTVTKTVFIGAVALVATTLHGCSSKKETTPHETDDKSAKTPAPGSGSSASLNKKQVEDIQARAEVAEAQADKAQEAAKSAEAALKAEQQNTANAANINTKQAAKIETLKAEKKEAEAKAKAAEEAAARKAPAAEPTDEDSEFEALSAKYEAAVKTFVESKNKKSESELTEDELEELADYLEFEADGQFKDHVAARKEKGLQNAEMLDEAFKKITKIEGAEKAQNVFQSILKRIADKKGTTVEDLEDEGLDEDDYAEIARKVQDHIVEVDLDKQVKSLEKTKPKVAEGIKEAGQKAKEFDAFMEDQPLDDNLNAAELKEVAKEFKKTDTNLEALKAAANTATDKGQKQLLDKLAALVREQGVEEDHLKETLEDFKEYAKDKYDGRAFEDLTKEEIKDLMSEIGQAEQAMELERLNDDEEIGGKFEEAATEVKDAAKSGPKKETLKKKVEKHDKAKKAAAKAQGDLEKKKDARKAKRAQKAGTIGF